MLDSIIDHYEETAEEKNRKKEGKREEKYR